MRKTGGTRLQAGMLSLLGLVFALLLLLDVAYFIHGSLELFPTQEQQGKIKGIAALAGFGFALVELVILALLRRLCARTHRTRNSVKASTPDGMTGLKTASLHPDSLPPPARGPTESH
jgi:hypothetical protein